MLSLEEHLLAAVSLFHLTAEVGIEAAVLTGEAPR
jgi:hypothetical protein